MSLLDKKTTEDYDKFEKELNKIMEDTIGYTKRTIGKTGSPICKK